MRPLAGVGLWGVPRTRGLRPPGYRMRPLAGVGFGVVRPDPGVFDRLAIGCDPSPGSSADTHIQRNVGLMSVVAN